MAERYLIRQCLNILNLIGTNPLNSNKWSKVRIVVSQLLLTTVAVEILLLCLYDWKGLDSMDAVSIFIATYQIIFKISLMVAKRTSLIRILNYMHEFWPSNKYGTAFQNEIEGIFSTTKKFATCTVGVVIVTSFVYFLKPLLASVRTLPHEAYHPRDINNSPGFELIYTLEITTSVVAASCIMGFDGLFVCTIVNIVCELKIVTKGFLEIPINAECEGDEKDTMKELGQLIDHHNLILRCIKDLNGVYCIYLLNLFSANMFCIGIGLLCITMDGTPPSMDTITKYGLYLMIYVGQLFFYCIVGTFLINESENVSNAVYETDWCSKPQPKLRKAYVLIIQRANKTEKLTAGGMFTLNLDSFATILKSAFSFFTFIQAVIEVE